MNVLRALILSTILGAGLLIGTPPQAVAQEPQGIKVVVDNNSYFDMHVYAVQTGMRRSLGLVTGLSKRSFEIPRTFVESGRDIQLLADPIGSQGYYLTDEFYLYPGTQLNLNLQQNLGLSWYTRTDQRPSEEELLDLLQEAEELFKVQGNPFGRRQPLDTSSSGAIHSSPLLPPFVTPLLTSPR